MFEFFNAQPAIKFADEIAADFHRIFIEEKNYTKPDKEQKINRRYRAVIQRTAEFSRANKMNFYKKSKFLTHLKYRLIEMGHEETLAAHAVHTLLTQV